MGFFDFLSTSDRYGTKPRAIRRLNARHRYLIAPFADLIAGARVFDVASHDGRWAYAFSAAGARSVVGVEARAELIAGFDAFPDAALRARVDLRCNDLFDELEAEVARAARYDIVSLFGILYHTMDHFRLLRAVHGLRPRMVIIDGEFVDRPNPVIQMAREDPSKVLNATPQTAGKGLAVIGIPSFRALEEMADALGYVVEWLDWTMLPEQARHGVGDYFRDTGMRRASCIMRPRGTQGAG